MTFQIFKVAIVLFYFKIFMLFIGYL